MLTVHRDARDYQIIFLCSFLSLGILARDWSLSPLAIAVVLATALTVQSLFTINQQGNFSRWFSLDTWQSLWRHQGWKSALITGLGLCLLLRANHLSTLILAASLAIASKFLLQAWGKHWFNPANFGIIAALSLTGDAWVSPGQWGTTLWLGAVFLAAGGLVLGKVGRWDTSIMFLTVYAGLDLARNAWLGWPPEVSFHHLENGSLLVFALFMITDPRSIPNGRPGRLLWATAIAIFSLILQYHFYLPTALFWALFCLSPLTVLLDRQFPAPRFQWWQKNNPVPSN
ncbi:RnfABCDGE type electron transport complex subunit D [Synechocystis sp. B12]|nr:RnfABCDGE type electron transport complex subunit D [Synechocystis sp. B12]